MTSSLPIYTKSEEFFWEQIIFFPYIKYSTNDSINDPITDLGLEIIKTLKLNPVISTVKLTEVIQATMPFVNRDMIKLVDST